MLVNAQTLSQLMTYNGARICTHMNASRMYTLGPVSNHSVYKLTFYMPVYQTTITLTSLKGGVSLSQEMCTQTSDGLLMKHLLLEVR